MHQIILPSAKELIPYVHSFNVFDNNLNSLKQKGHTNKMIPDALADIWLIKGDFLLFSHDNINYRKLPNEIVWGLFNTCNFMKTEGVSEVVSIKFKPWAFNLFFDFSLEKNTNSCLPISDILSNDDVLFFQKSRLLKNPIETIYLIESYLLKELKKGRAINKYIVNAYNLIVSTKGNIQINELATKLQISRQQLNKGFKKTVGFSIKEFIDVYRIRLCVDYKLDLKSPTLTELSYAFDFFDQAHFIRQFKRIVGETPSSYFSRKHLIKQQMRE